jgi:hypothetical protein
MHPPKDHDALRQKSVDFPPDWIKHGCCRGYFQTRMIVTTWTATIRIVLIMEWCHYLAGIHLVPKAAAAAAAANTATTPTNTTRSIVQTLTRRIRANATLKYILQSLQQQHNIPHLPSALLNASNTALNSSWQLVSFTQQPQSTTTTATTTTTTTLGKQEQPQQSSSVFIYDVHCKKTQTLGKQEQPQQSSSVFSVPPQWTLTTSLSSDKQSQAQPLHNATWTLLEHSLNHDLLLSCNENEVTKDSIKQPAAAAATSNGSNSAANKKDDDDNQEDESTLLFAEWILVHQFHKLLEVLPPLR